MIPIQVEVYSFDDPTEMLDVLNARIKPSFMEELRGPGGGEVNLSITDPKILANPTLIRARNVLKIRVDGKIVGGIVLNAKTTKIVQDSASKEQYEVSGESFRTWLNDAIVYPEGGLRKSSYQERAFNFASTRGEWYDEEQWDTPTNVVKWGDIVGSPWRYAPANWPDVPDAYWIWSNNSISSAPAGDNYFRYEFTTATDGKYSFFVAADDSYAIYIDGQLNTVSQTDTIAWSDVERVDVDLPAGDHIFAVKVTNTGGPAALIAAVFRAGDAATETPATLISYTGKVGDTNWKVAGYPDPLPGWSPGEIMRVLLEEAETRGVRFPLWLTPTFTDTLDSYGNTWARDLDWSFSIGSSLADVVEKLEELVCDLWIDPETLELNMVAERGVDRSVYGYDVDEVTVIRPILVFEKGKNLGQSSIDSNGEIKNALIVQTAEGWMAAEDGETDSLSTYGRIEALLDTGVSEAVSEAVADLVFKQKANPEEGASYEIVPVPGHVPWVDFQVGDWVLAPNDVGLLVKRRVMSISVKEDSDNGQPIYEVEFDTIFKDNEDKLSRWMSKMGGGTLGGQFANSGGGSSLPIGQPTIPPTGSAPILVPNSPTDLTASSIGLWEVNGTSAYSQVTLDWNPVTGNTDGSATVPLGYEVWGHLASESDNTYRRLALVFTNQATLQPYETGSEWEFKVRALNPNNALGAFSNEVTHTMVAPNTPMDAPDAPTLSSSKGVLIVTWSGELDGNTPPPQFRYVYAEISDTESGTYLPMGATLSRDGRDIYISGLAVGDSPWVRLRAVDGLGLVSDPSTAVQHTITGIDLGDLDESVEEAIDAANEAARKARSTTNMFNDPSFEANDPTLWSLETADVTNQTTDPRTGLRALRIDSTSSAYTASKYGLVMEVDEGESYLYSAYVRAVSTGATIDFGVTLSIEYGDDPESLSSTDDVVGSPANADDYTPFGGIWVVPAGARYARPIIRMTDETNTNDYLVDDMSFRMMIPNALIVDGAITADKIGAGEVVAGKLAAGSVAAENIQAGAVVAGTIAAGAVTANEIAAGTITSNEIAAGTISVVNLEPDIGDTINISGNVSIVSVQESVTEVQDGLEVTNSDLTEMRTYYDFGPDGAVISTPDSPFQLKLSADKIQMLELGNEVSYWNAGTMYVRSFVGEEVILGNHKLEKYGTGTVVRAL